jgi:hypothetical protein
MTTVPETQRIFTLLGHGYGSISLPVDMLVGKKLDTVGLWVWVGDVVPNPQTHGFLNPLFHNRREHGFLS